MVTAVKILLVLTATATGLMAGLFFAFSCAVNLGLARLSNAEYAAAMKSINRRIQNPGFFAAFFGAPLFLIISTILHCNQSPHLWLLLAATVVYFIGTLSVTIFGNVPMNNALDRFDLESATDAEIAAQRANFEIRWDNLNTIRAVSSTLALILVVIACLSI